MGRFWVKAIRPIIRHDLTGAYTRYQPGDWFECRNQERAELMRGGFIASGNAGIDASFDGIDAGVLMLGTPAPLDFCSRYSLEMQQGQDVELPWERTVLWRTHTRLTPEAAVLGLMRIDAGNDESAWEMAAMLKSETKTARSIGSEEERARTLEVLGDLRLPIYDTGVLWVRRTEATKEVINLWREEVDAGADERHAFLRTIYTNPVLLCTLPPDWVGQWMRG